MKTGTFSPGKHAAIVVVHGWLPQVYNCERFLGSQATPGEGIPGSDYFIKLRTELVPRYRLQHKVYYFTYPAYNDVRVSGPQLARRIKELLATGNIDRVVIVAHSMGGLVSRIATAQVQADPLTVGRVRGLITLATPHLGSPLAPEPAVRVSGSVTVIF